MKKWIIIVSILMLMSVSLWGDEANTKEEIILQLASFSHKVNAEKYVQHKEEIGRDSELGSLPFEIKIVEVYIQQTEQMIYRVIAITDCVRIASDIMGQLRYRGAFIIEDPLKE